MRAVLDYIKAKEGGSLPAELAAALFPNVHHRLQLFFFISIRCISLVFFIINLYIHQL